MGYHSHPHVVFQRCFSFGLRCFRRVLCFALLCLAQCADFCWKQRSREAEAWGHSLKVPALVPCAPKTWFSRSTTCHITMLVGALVRLGGRQCPRTRPGKANEKNKNKKSKNAACKTKSGLWQVTHECLHTGTTHVKIDLAHASRIDADGRRKKGSRKGRGEGGRICLLYTSPSPRDGLLARMPSSA